MLIIGLFLLAPTSATTITTPARELFLPGHTSMYTYTYPCTYPSAAIVHYETPTARRAEREDRGAPPAALGGSRTEPADSVGRRAHPVYLFFVPRTC